MTEVNSAYLLIDEEQVVQQVGVRADDVPDGAWQIPNGWSLVYLPRVQAVTLLGKRVHVMLQIKAADDD